MHLLLCHVQKFYVCNNFIYAYARDSDKSKVVITMIFFLCREDETEIVDDYNGVAAARKMSPGKAASVPVLYKGTELRLILHCLSLVRSPATAHTSHAQESSDVT